MANGNGKNSGFWKGVVVGLFTPVAVGIGAGLIGLAAGAVAMATGKKPAWDGKGTFTGNGTGNGES